uniref:Uncharacterized protein n=1 Tax=viral metagenome TaxID=1070528 RepID=A0A6H1ZAR1_9ZZZZ
MALVTGTPKGTITSQEELYLEGAPYLYFQDATANPLFNPDANGFYYGLSATAAYPVYQIGCPEGVTLTEGITMTDIQCDNIGVKNTIQRRNFIDLTLTVRSMFPLTVMRHMLNLGMPTTGTDYETVPIGGINNLKFYMLYAPKVYDDDAGDFILFHFHRCKFVDAWTIGLALDGWNVTGIKIRAFADEAKPDVQKFGVIRRSDVSAL